MAKDAFYFSHDSNAKDDPKCVLLIEQLGLEGYGIFWVLIETLRDQPEYKYPVVLIPALARRYNTTTEKMKTVITQYDLFQIENNEFFYSQSLLKRMEKWDDKRIKNIKAGQISAQKRLAEKSESTSVEPMLNTCSTIERKRKEKKGKEIKEEYIEFSPLQDAIDEFVKFRKGIKKPMTDRAIELLSKKLEDMAHGNDVLKIALLEQSILNGWLTIYPLKLENQPKPKPGSNELLDMIERGEFGD